MDRFEIRELEERIAPSGHCAILQGLDVPEHAAEGIAKAQDAAGCGGDAAPTV